MRQQINLYQPVASDERRPLESRTLGLLAGGVVACLLVIWGFGLRQVAALEKSVATLRAQQEAQTIAMTELGAQRPAGMNLVTVQAQVKALNQQIAARTQALDFLHHGSAGQTIGFANRMEALARRHTDGLWIDRVVLSGTTGAMSVGGSTVNPDLVPRYLRALATESALTGTRFDALTIERPSHNAEDSSDKPTPSRGSGIRFRAESNSLHSAEPEKPS